MNIFEGIGEDILKLLYGYVAAQSCTGTVDENSGADYFIDSMKKVPYFAAHPENLIRYPIKNDPLGRAACCAMFRGTSPDTVVMIHHFDVTSVEDYGRFSDIAFEPDEVVKVLRGEDVALEQEVRDDLESGDFLFGHGVCDMKGGGSIQLTLLSRLSEQTDFPGTLIVLGVPDEENLSAGMRAAVSLLRELKDQYGLNYKLMINSEPHQRKTPDKGVFSIGSTGKLLPFVYAKGRMSHAGKASEGLNPFAVISRIVAKTEGLPFTGDGAPTPTWLMLRDDKLHYDVSMPRSAFGCMSVLTFYTSAAQVLEKLRAVCEDAFAECLHTRASALGLDHLPWEPRVYSWTELRAEAEKIGGKAWTESLEKLLSSLHEQVLGGKLSFADAYRKLLEFTCNELPDVPIVVYGFMPPYYPSVTNGKFTTLPENIEKLDQLLNEYSKEHFHQEYETELFYTGISDLSYSSMTESEEGGKLAFIQEMPLYGKSYALSVEDLNAIAMPCINVGPWGKDFHKLAERVCISDLTRKTPELVYKAIKIALNID